MQCKELDEAIRFMKSTGYRGLLVIHTSNINDVIDNLAKNVSGNCLLVAPKTFRIGKCKLEKSPMDIEEYLGLEFESAIIASQGLMRPSVIASAAETIVSGGFLALVAPPRPQWDPGPEESRGYYKKYIEKSIPKARIHLWMTSECKKYSMRLETPNELVRNNRPTYRSRKGIPKKLMNLTRTIDQARGLDIIREFLVSSKRSLLVTGNRGRGKSYLVGLGIAYGIYRKLLGKVEIVGPTLGSVQSLMRGLFQGLNVLNIKHSKIINNGKIIRISGPWFRVSFEKPENARGGPLTVIDEAASVGIARIRRLSWKSSKIIVTTTIHGYEGSGRVFLHLIDSVLPKPSSKIKLETPIRYKEGDPLESWVYETFILNPEPTGPMEISLDELKYRQVKPEELVENKELFKRIYNILVLAHYRNTPDDILAILEGEGHNIHILEWQGQPVATAQTVEEAWNGDPRARIALERLAYFTEKARDLTARRISRIAVLPWLQRTGIGSLLLRKIIDITRDKDLITVIFSRHDIVDFWIKNNFIFYYVSPRFNKMTGEKNLAAAKPVTKRGKEALIEASRIFRLRLLLSSQSIYRDLEAEKILKILNNTLPVKFNFKLYKNQYERVMKCARGQMDIEQAWDALWLLTIKMIAEEESFLEEFEMREKVFIVARILQGKNADEAAWISGIDSNNINILYNKLCKKILEKSLPL